MFIGVDWGTVKLRARLISFDGAILDCVEVSVRLADLTPEDIEAQVRKFYQRWPAARGPILMAGMIGSSLGWRDVSHLTCPVNIEGLAHRLSYNEIDGNPVLIVPGLKCSSRFGDSDVMRGEETLAAGLIVSENVGNALILSVPGMHGKWIEISGGAITRFHTSMTVELAYALAENSFLASAMKELPVIGPAFFKGVDRGFSGGGLGRLLFTARTGVLSGALDARETASYIWGILIGSDIREIDASEYPQLYVSGSNDTVGLFAAALSHVKVRSKAVSMDHLFAHGFNKIRQHLQR